MNRIGWVSAALLVALGATHQAMGPSAPSGAKQQAQSSNRSYPAQSETTDLCAALRASFSLPFPDPDQIPPCLPGGHNILFVIATTPNPANSQLALAFDRTIESIERAAGDRGFLFDRFVFPWDAEPHRQLDPEKKRAEEKRRRDSEAKPGILLFRGHFDEGDPMHRFELLAVMLVPENPSSGVNGNAFQVATTFAKENGATEPLAILGPGYSSSAVSLHNAMRQTTFQYLIRTGTATVPEAWKLLDEDTHAFAATVRDDDQASEALFQHLTVSGEWKKVGRVAILSESGTLYGAHAISSGKRSNNPPLNLVFPRGISWLRNAYQDVPVAPNPSLPAGVASPTSALLPFAISEPSYGDDKTPSISKTQTPLSQEEAMLSIANTLRRERVRFVVITSSDPLDNIFLIRFLRAHCPDLRIITFESDLLYVRAATEYSATGVVLVSSYPLFLQNQIWSAYDLSENRVPFDSMGSEGTYNALRSILMLSGQTPNLKSGAAPLAGADDLPLDYRGPFEPVRKPPVWLTVSTPSGYWPLAVLGDKDLHPTIASKFLYSWPEEEKNNEAVDPVGAPTIEGVSRFWYSLALGLTGVCVLLLLALQRKLNCANVPLLCSFTCDFPEDGHSLGRAFCRTVILLSVVLLCALQAWPVVVLRHNGPSWEALTIAGVLVAAAVGLLLAAGFNVAQALRSPFAARTRHYWFLFLILIALVTFWLENWRRTFSGGLHHEGFFTAYRSLDLVNGVAPTIPFALLCLALISWAWIHLRRLRILGQSPHSAPALGTRFLEPSEANDLRDEVKDVDNAVQDPFLLPAWAYIAGVSSVAALYLVMGEYTQSLELRPFDELYGVAFAVMVLLLLLTCARMLFVWVMLRRLLRTIEQHPIREIFGTVPLAEHWGPILHRGIDSGELKRRRRELLHTPAIKGAAIADCALEDMRDAVLDPAWAEQDLEREAFKANSELFALSYVTFIQAACRQIENLLVFLPIGFVLTLISLNSYSFQSGHVLGWFMATLLIAIGIAVGFMLAAAERDEVLSRLNGTTPGKIGKDFYMNLLSYGALPVLTVLAAQFPSIGSFLFSWVQPVLQALRG